MAELLGVKMAPLEVDQLERTVEILGILEGTYDPGDVNSITAVRSCIQGARNVRAVTDEELRERTEEYLERELHFITDTQGTRNGRIKVYDDVREKDQTLIADLIGYYQNLLRMISD